jgi:CRP-like cAMP-binding protein
VLAAACKAAIAAAALARREQREGGPLPLFPLFSALPVDPFVELVALLKPRAFITDEVVIEQGTPGDSIFIVARGAVRITRRSVTQRVDDSAPEQHERTVALLRAGAFFGEMALLTDQPRTARAVCDSDAVLFEVGRAGLEELSKRHPSVPSALADYCRHRLLENLMATSRLFRALPPEERPGLMAMFEARSCEAGTLLLREGAEGDGLFMILTGRAVVEKSDGGEQLRLAELSAGDVFGEISLMRARPATAGVRAHTRTSTLFLPREAFESVAGRYPALAGAVFALATERERNTAQALAGDATPAEDCLV